MNLGIYVETISDPKYLPIISNITAYSLEQNTFDDISVFYDNVGPIENKLQCGMFNSTDIWNFSGKLLIFTLDCAKTCLGVVNNFEIYYYFGLENINALNLLDILNKNIKIICIDKEAKRKFYRLTGQFPIGTSNEIKHITNYLLKSNEN